MDEAYLHYHWGGSSAASRDMSQQLNLSRQHNQTLLSQEARQVDRNIASSALVLSWQRVLESQA